MKPINILVIVGPTASGKSDLAVKMALEKNGEVISADSRQVYSGLDIGTGKITTEEMRGVPHHCLDIADPRERFTVVEWKKAAEKAIDDISKRGKLPIICGGTGFYISALVDGLEFPDVEIDPVEQKELEARPIEELFEELMKLDPRRASDMERNGDSKNKRRVVRAILIARKFGAVPPLEPISSLQKLDDTKCDFKFTDNVHPDQTTYQPDFIGILPSDNELKTRIKNRLIKRLENGMIEEARHLHEEPPKGIGLSYERMNELGLEYRYLAQYLQGQLTREQLIETLSTKIWQYARRQKTWFKRDKRIKWITP